MVNNYKDNGDFFYSVNDSKHCREKMSKEELKKEISYFNNCMRELNNPNHTANLEARIAELKSLLNKK
jgi:hypothetical protein